MSEQPTQPQVSAPKMAVRTRKPYHAPRLEDFGAVNELTRTPYKFGIVPDFGENPDIPVSV